MSKIIVPHYLLLTFSLQFSVPTILLFLGICSLYDLPLLSSLPPLWYQFFITDFTRYTKSKYFTLYFTEDSSYVFFYVTVGRVTLHQRFIVTVSIVEPSLISIYYYVTDLNVIRRVVVIISSLLLSYYNNVKTPFWRHFTFKITVIDFIK